MLNLRYCVISLFFCLILAENDITVHIIPHSHQDPGWRVTMDQYYDGYVRRILTSVTESLNAHPNRKFTHVEQSFFQRWWGEVSDTVKNTSRKLVQNGQFELNLGGWVMHDEACTNYEEMIHQMSLGTKFVKEQFGIRPRVGWHIDPFGHSSQNARLMAEMGFDAFGLNRIDYIDKENRRQTQTLENVWRGSRSLEEKAEIFTFNFWDHYYSPPDIKFNTWSVPRNMSDSEQYWTAVHPQLRGFGWDIPKIADAFVPICKEKAKFFNNGGNVLIPFGADFSFTNADSCYNPMDELISYVNSNYAKYQLRFRYSTFGDYINIIHGAQRNWPVFKGDYFPYTDKATSYWTGYYTSRPDKKGLIRSAYNYLRSSELLYSDVVIRNKTKLRPALYDKIMVLRKNQAVNLHHDAITGTEKQKVHEDYINMLNTGIQNANDVIIQTLEFSMGVNGISLNGTALINKLVKPNMIGVIIYNSNSWPVKQIVSIIVGRNDLAVLDSKKIKVPYQINSIPSYSIDSKTGSHYLYFAVDIPALGYSTYYVTVSSSISTIGKLVSDSYIQNSKYEIQLDSATGHVSRLIIKPVQRTVKFEEQLYQYEGTKYAPFSGAYAFRPQIWNGDKTSADNSVHTVIIPYVLDKPSLLTIFSTPNECKTQEAVYITNQKLEKDQLVYHHLFPQTRSKSIYNALIPVNNENINPDTVFGSYVIGAQTVNPFTITVTFSKTFKSTNSIKVQTALFGDIESESFLSSVTAVTSNSFTILVECVESGAKPSGWKSNLKLDYLIYESRPFTTFWTHMNVFDNTEKISIDSKYVVTTVQLPKSFRENYFVIASIKSTGTVVVANIISTSPDSFVVACISPNYLTSFMAELDYILVPVDTYLESVKDIVTPTIIKGPLVEEVQISYRNGYSETVKLYNTQYDNNNRIEYVYDLGPTDAGKEVISRFKTDIDNKEDTFYSDLNGLESLERHNLFKNIKDNVGGNYYPSVNTLFLEGKDLRLTILHDRAHGSASFGPGQLEFMLQRRTIHDDSYGVDEALVDNPTFQVKSWILVDFIIPSTEQHRQLSRLLSHPLLPYYHPDLPICDSHSLIKIPLPNNIELLSFHLMDNTNKVTIRFHHIFEKNEHETLSQPVSVDLNQLFTGLNFTGMKEMILTGYSTIEEVEKDQLKWKTADSKNYNRLSTLQGTSIVLNAMEFKTLITTIN